MIKINIAIDGYSACGKSSTAIEVAKLLNYIYIDTGAMYRAVTLYLLENDINIANIDNIEIALQNIQLQFKNIDNNRILYLNNNNVEQAIRQPKIASLVSEVSTISVVRKKMVEQQQQMAAQKGVVMDGRDIGSVVLPNAELKFFMTANIDIRTKRRQKELLEKTGQLYDLKEIEANLIHRDNIDSTRSDSPLTLVKDAMIIDTSFITLDEQIDMIYQKAIEKIKEQV